MHNLLAVLTQQTMADPYIGGRTEESSDNSQLVLGLYRLENPTGIVTIPTQANPPKNLPLLLGQLSRGIAIGSKSYYDERTINTIAEELAEKYDGSGGSLLADCDQYRSVEFPTESKEKMVAEYFG